MNALKSPLNLTGYHLHGRLAAKDNPGGLDQGRTLLKAIVTAVNSLRHDSHIGGLSEGVAPVCFPEPASGTGSDSFIQQQVGFGNQILADAASAREVIKSSQSADAVVQVFADAAEAL